METKKPGPRDQEGATSAVGSRGEEFFEGLEDFMKEKEFSMTKQFCGSIFEQYWTHLRHLESERMWIMGIWLGITGLVFKEIWMGEDAPGLLALRYISAAHLILTLGVLSITLKLQLELSKHHWSICEMTKERAPKYKHRVEGVWQIICPSKEENEKKAPSMMKRKGGFLKSFLPIPILRLMKWIGGKLWDYFCKPILTLGGVVAGILIAGILTDLTLLARSLPYHFLDFVCGLDWWIFLCAWVIIFVVYQLLFNFLVNKLDVQLIQ